MNPVTRTRSEKQALVAFATMTSALLGVSFSSGRGRCSIQYHPPARATTMTTANAGLRYSESIIAGSIQSYGREERLLEHDDIRSKRHTQTILVIHSLFPHGRASSRPSKVFLLMCSRDVDPRHEAGHPELSQKSYPG